MAWAAPTTVGPASGRQLAATAILVVALWGARLVGVVWRCRGTRRAGWGRVLSAGWDAATRVHAGAERTLWARPEHARGVFDDMPWQPRESQTKRELAEIGYGLGKNLRTCWLGQELKLTRQI